MLSRFDARVRHSSFLFGLLLVVTLLLRVSAFRTPLLDVDESQFAGYAHALLEGGRPFIDSVDTKPTGIYWFFAVILGVFGEYNMMAVHGVTALWVFATACYTGRIASWLYGPKAGWIAAFFYAVYSTCGPPKLISTSITSLMTLPLAASVWEILQWEDGKKNRLWLAGAFFGLGCLFKYQAGIQLFAVFSYFILIRARRGVGLRSEIKNVLIFAAGACLVGAPYIAYLFFSGAWGEFYFYTVQGNIAYLSKNTSLASFIENFINWGLPSIGFALPLWVLGLAGALRPWQGRRPSALLIKIWFAFSLIALAAGGRFYGHYYLQVLPPLCVLAAPKCLQAWEALKAKKIALSVLIFILALPALFACALRQDLKGYYARHPQDHPELYRYLADYVRLRTSPEDEIFVWGFATPIYFYSQRGAASRFLWCDWLTGKISGKVSRKNDNYRIAEKVAKRSWTLLFQDLGRHKPAYIIDTSPGDYHGYGKYPMMGYSAMAEFTRTHYFLEARYGGADFYRRKGD